MAEFGDDVLEEHKVMLFYSDYSFLPEGLRFIKHNFDELMSNENLFSKLDYKHKKSYFVLTCKAEDSDTIWKIFQALYNGIIRTEVSDGYDLDSKLIAEIVAVKDETEGSDTDDGDTDDGDTDDSDTESTGISTTKPEENVPLNVQGCWKWLATDESLENVIPQEALLEIAALTGTRLVGDLGNQSIYMYGKSRNDCEKVAQKLDILQKYHYLARRFCRHSFFTEGEIDFEVCTPTLSDVHKKLIETTLIDPLNSSLKHEDLTKVRTVRCCLYSNVQRIYKMSSRSKMSPAVLKSATCVSLRQWSGYHYPCRGGESWKQRNVFQNSKDESFEATTNRIEIQNTYSLINLDSDNLMDLETEVEVSQPSQAAHKNDNPSSPTQSRRGIRGSAGIRDLRRSSLTESEKTLTSNNPPTPKLISFDDDENASHRDEVHKRPQGSQTLLDDDIAESERRSLASVELEETFGLRGLRIGRTALVTIGEEMEEKILTSQPQKDNAGTCIEVTSISETKVSERREEVPMRLPVFVAFEYIPFENITRDFAQDIEESSYTMLNSVRNYSGIITLKCHFGRLMIKPLETDVMNSLQSKLNHKADFVKSILHKFPGEVDFTKNITTLSADINFIQCMEIEETGQRIWNKFPQESSVMYEFVCCEHHDSEEDCENLFVIEIDADSFAASIRSPMFNFGMVMVHCTIRNWDYMISLDGAADMLETYQDVAHSIKETMRIGPQCKKLSMSFELHRCHRLHFASIRVHRRTQHKSYDGRTLLNITEVHDLDWTSEITETGNIYSVTESEDPLSTWYEVDMESVDAKVAFEENPSLEFAEETEWSAENLIEDGVIVKDLCIPANYIVTRIDGVGFHNDNGIRIADGSSDIIDPSELPEEQGPQYRFW